MKKIMNLICVGLAFVFLGLGAVGIILPVLPTTPFLLVAAALFAKGSETFHRWFISTRIYNNHIEKVVMKKAMTRKSKIKLLIMITILFVIGVLIAPIWHAKAFIVFVLICHYYYFICRIKTIDFLE